MHTALAALDRASRGRFDEARLFLDTISAKDHGSVIGQVVFSQRAALDLYEGHLESAVGHATTAAREGRRLGAVERLHQGSALSIRAIAEAGLGQKDAALADVAKVRTAEYRQAAFVARAALAEAILFAREKDLEGLAKVLREERALLFGATGPRERMVARALARMVAAKKVSVYREAAKREVEELDENASWIARLTPEAAAFAEAPKLGPRGDAPKAVEPEVAAQADKSAARAKISWKPLVVSGLLVALFVVVWSALAPSNAPTSEAPATDSSIPWAWGFGGLSAWIALVAGIVAFRLARAKRLTRDLSQAIEMRLRGNHDEARAVFEKLSKSSVPLVAPQAQWQLAAIATTEGDFRSAQRHAEAGIAATRTSPAVLAVSRPVLLPQLHGELAFSLAAEGRVARAEEELEKLHAQFPTSPYLARDTFRVRLVGAAATGRLDEAAEMARGRPVDLFLSMDEELLCDALRVNAGDALPEGEGARIELDLREGAPAGKFLDRVAPALRSRAKTRIAPPSDSTPPYSEAPTSEEEGDSPVAVQEMARELTLGVRS